MSSLAERGLSTAGEENRLPGEQEISAAMERILHSETFRRCPRLRDFLSFVVDCSLHDRLHEINEYSLGIQVFGKPDGYNPSQDNIVRATARQLRTKLAEYYLSEGSSELWHIEIPKGAYVPTWLSPVHTPIPIAVPDVPAPIALPPIRSRSKWLLLWVSLAAVAIFTGAFFLGRSGRSEPTAEVSLLTNLLGSSRVPATLVLDDSSLPMLSNLTGKSIGLKDYLEKSYLNLAPPGDARLAATLQDLFGQAEFTSASTAQLLAKVAFVAAQSGQPVRVTHSRDLQVRDLNSGNFIFFGGIGSNPWLDLVQQNTTYQHFFQPGGRRGFTNRHALPGEPSEFAVSGPGDSGKTSYARLAIFKNPMGTGQVALIGGTSRLSTEAAGDFALSHARFVEVTKLCSGFSSTPPHGFEVILETTSIAGAPVSAHIVAHRCEIPKNN